MNEVKEYWDWDEKLDTKTGKMVKFNELQFLNDWWNGLDERYKANVFRQYMGEDPIENWKK